jgi:hypothetical protein
MFGYAALGSRDSIVVVGALSGSLLVGSSLLVKLLMSLVMEALEEPVAVPKVRFGDFNHCRFVSELLLRFWLMCGQVFWWSFV